MSAPETVKNGGRDVTKKMPSGSFDSLCIHTPPCVMLVCCVLSVHPRCLLPFPDQRPKEDSCMTQCIGGSLLWKLGAHARAIVRQMCSRKNRKNMTTCSVLRPCLPDMMKPRHVLHSLVSCLQMDGRRWLKISCREVALSYP